MTASSYGFGEAIRAALTLSRHRLVLALGGSASTDGGIGMLAALGYRFLDRAGDLLAPIAENLNSIHCVDSQHAVDLNGIEFTVAGDVTSPLLGLTGAAAVFGPQKGATAAQVAQLDAGLENLVAALHAARVSTPPERSPTPRGSGAAGGIGFAAMLLGATTASGAEYFLDLLNFDQHRRRCRPGHHRRRTARRPDPAGKAARRGRTARRADTGDRCRRMQRSR